MSPDTRHEPVLIPGTLPSQGRLKGVVRHFFGLVVVGVLIGLACLPLNLVDRVQSQFYALLPTTAAKTWGWQGLLIALMPLVVMPVLLLLQRGPWQAGAGSGIPSTMNSLEDPSRLPKAMAAAGPFNAVCCGPSPLSRCFRWDAKVPLFNSVPPWHGPVIVASALAAFTCERQMVAIGGGAGLAGGFNTPLLGAVFMLEELTADYAIVTIWPALVISVAAAGFSNIGGEPMFGLGVLNIAAPESEQLLMAIPIGIVCGLIGGAFNRGLVWLTKRLAPMVELALSRQGYALEPV